MGGHARAMGLNLLLPVFFSTVETDQEQKQSWGQQWLSRTCFPKEGPFRQIFIATLTSPTFTENVLGRKARSRDYGTVIIRLPLPFNLVSALRWQSPAEPLNAYVGKDIWVCLWPACTFSLKKNNAPSRLRGKEGAANLHLGLYLKPQAQLAPPTQVVTDQRSLTLLAPPSKNLILWPSSRRIQKVHWRKWSSLCRYMWVSVMGIHDGDALSPETSAHAPPFPSTSLEHGKMYEIMLWAQSSEKT